MALWTFDKDIHLCEKKDFVMKFLMAPGTFDKDIHTQIREEATYCSRQYLYYLCDNMVEALLGHTLPEVILNRLFFQAHLSFEEGFRKEDWYSCSVDVEDPIVKEVEKKIGEFFSVDVTGFLTSEDNMARAEVEKSFEKMLGEFFK